MTTTDALPFSRAEMLEALEAKLVNRQFHPEHSLEIWNYSSIAQITRAWTPVTMACRGLIIDHVNDVVVARPFPKFFNHTETAVPKFALTTPPVVTDKLDGSLGIVYPTPDGYRVATRGSFASDQALWASGWLEGAMPDFSQPDGVTTLVEIIYPQNRIVVDYRGREELVLLGAVDNATGADIPLWEIDWWDGARTEMHTGLGDMDAVNRFAISDAKKDDEGVVAVWYKPGEPAFRLKVKHAEYIRLHRIITGFNTKTIWEVLSKDGDFAEVLDRVPDEFYGWVKGVVGALQAEYNQIEKEAIEEFQQCLRVAGREDRKAFAAQAKKKVHTGLIFAMLDGKDYSGSIWASIKPKAEKPFAEQEEEV